MNKKDELYIIKGFITGIHKEYILKLKTSDFKDKDNKTLFSQLKSMHITNSLFNEDDGRLNIANVTAITKKRPSDLLNGTYNIDIVKHYALIEELIKDRAVNAALKFSAGNITESDLKDEITEIFAELKQDKTKIPENIGEYMVCKLYDDIVASHSSKRIPFGFVELDNLTVGMAGGQLITIAGRTGTGKSALALQIALNAAAMNKRVIYISAEMSKMELAQRIVQQKIGIPPHRIKAGDLTTDDLRMINAFVDKKELDNLFIVDNVKNFDKINALVKESKPDLVIIDQLSLIELGINVSSIRERYIHLTRKFKNMAKENNIPVIELAQLSRIEREVIPQLNSLKESGSIEEDSDVVLLLHKFAYEGYEEHAARCFDKFSNPDIYKKNGYIPYMLNVPKQRSGSTGRIPMLFKPEKVRFFDV